MIGGSASGASTDASVVPIDRSSMPVTSTMSPASADVDGHALQAGEREHLRRPCAFAGTCALGQRPVEHGDFLPGAMRPRRMRPMPRRPT